MDEEKGKRKSKTFLLLLLLLERACFFLRKENVLICDRVEKKRI